MRERCDSWMRARVRKCAQGFATAVAMATAFAVHADFTVIDSATALDAGGASGGDIVRRVNSGVDTYDIVHIFTNATSAQTFTVPARNHIVPNSFQVLVVGGGGSGGGDCGGGGGGGGVVTNAVLVAGQSYVVAVGAGGLPRAHGNIATNPTYNPTFAPAGPGENGGNTSISNRSGAGAGRRRRRKLDEREQRQRRSQWWLRRRGQRIVQHQCGAHFRCGPAGCARTGQ